VDGLRAPLVIHPTKEVHTYDDEFTVVLGDWYHTDHSILVERFMSIGNPRGAEPVPGTYTSSPFRRVSLSQTISESALMYFAQNSTYRRPIQGTSPSAVTSAVGFNENATLPFQPGKTYRLRIVNTSAFSAFFFWIDGHDMRIIEVDGVCFHLCFTDSEILFTSEFELIRLMLKNPLSTCSVSPWHNATLF